MFEAALDAPTGMNNDGTARFGAENQVFAIFYRGHKRDNFASQEAGYPIEKGVDMVEIRQVGEKDSMRREVSEIDKARWPARWAAYQQGREQVQDGTPLDLLFPKNPEIVATLRANNIHTIQALAAVPDSSKLQFVVDFKKRAVSFLEGIDKGKGFHDLEKRLETAEFEKRELQDRLASLERRLTAIDEDGEQKRGPGRPRKIEGE